MDFMINNFMPSLAAAIVSMLVGMIWFSPRVFGKPWAMLVFGSPTATAVEKRGMAKTYGIMFLAHIVMAFVVRYIVILRGIDVTTVGDGARIGLYLGIGLVVPTMLIMVLFEKQKVRLYLIDVGYYIVDLIILGMVLAAWK
jgi:hypothetical protein